MFLAGEGDVEHGEREQHLGEVAGGGGKFAGVETAFTVPGGVVAPESVGGDQAVDLLLDRQVVVVVLRPFLGGFHGAVERFKFLKFGFHLKATGEGVRRKGITNARHQRAPVLKQQVGAVDIGDLLHRDRRQVLQLRHRRQEGITPEHPSGVIIQRCTVVCTAGDGAAGGQQQQAGHCSRGRNASMKRCIWLVVPMLTRKHPSIKGLPAIERTRIPACRNDASTSATGRWGQISR